jgi:cytidyltransferase-like protein
MRKVMVFGTFDLFHPGHQDFLWQAWSMGNYLIVVIARDNNVLSIKKNKPSDEEDIRLKNVQRWLWQNNIPGEVWLGNVDFEKRYLILKKTKPDLICLGYDQRVDLSDLQIVLKEYKLDKVEIYRLRAYCPEIYKSSKLKKYENNHLCQY